MDNQILETLIKIGLTDAEAKIYLVLLELGSSQAVHITSKSALHRRTVYDAIERLVEKGLVSYIRENNIKKYLMAMVFRGAKHCFLRNDGAVREPGNSANER